MPRKPNYDRNALIDRARDLFWKQGWAGTSLKDLERTLGLNPGSFYAAFGSKNALFELALDRYAEGGVSRLNALVEEFGALGALQRYPSLVIDPSSASAKACMLAKTVLELKDQEEDLAACANAHLSNMETLFAALFREAQAAGQIAQSYDAETLARRYQSDLLGLRVTAERSDVSAEAIAQEIAESLVRLADKKPRQSATG
ncbi:MAG: TetR/AcrR family transcriptional regulator [Pseudomonadota bacterium]